MIFSCKSFHLTRKLEVLQIAIVLLRDIYTKLLPLWGPLKVLQVPNLKTNNKNYENVTKTLFTDL